MADKQLFEKIKLLLQAINAIFQLGILSPQLFHLVQCGLRPEPHPCSALLHSLIVPLPG